MLGDDDEKVPSLHDAVLGEDVDGGLGDTSGKQTANEGPHPELHGREVAAPFSSIVTKTDFEGKVNEHRERQVFV